MKKIFATVAISMMVYAGTSYCSSTADSMLKPLPDNVSIREGFKSRFHSADNFYSTGYWMAAAGLAALIVPAFFKESETLDGIMAVGSIGYLVGIPLTGIGSGRMLRLAKQCDTGYHPPGGGWIYYWTGKSLQMAGLACMAAQGLLMGMSAFSGQDMTNKYLENSGITLFAAGMGFDVFSWYRFMRVQRSAKPFAAKCSLSMLLIKDSQGRVAPGLVLSGDF
jgi:hypothetical protein